MAKKAGKQGATKRTPKRRPKLQAAESRRVKSEPERENLPKVASAWSLTKSAANLIWQHRRLFAGITLIYGLLNLLLVQGLANSTDVATLKNDLHKGFGGHLGSLGSGLGTFVLMVGSAGNGSSQTAGAYQLVLAVVVSLAVIWTLRQLFTGASVRVKQAYYTGMYPFVPFVLVILVVGLQLLPLVIGGGLYSLVTTNGIAVHAVERLVFGLIFFLLAAWTLYLLSSSLFALYIVTLPDMTPLKALRSAKQLVRYRRWPVMRKILWLPLVLLAGGAIIMLPIIIWLTALTQWVFFILTMFALVAVHAYMYTLYRELLHE